MADDYHQLRPQHTQRHHRGLWKPAAGYLEGHDCQGAYHAHIRPLPFLIGRQASNHLCLPVREISRQHAEIFQYDERLWIRDCGSTNGTYVNKQRIAGEELLHDGDILNFSSLEFQFSSSTASDTHSPLHALHQHFPYLNADQALAHCETEFNKMLNARAVVPHFQPIACLGNQQIIGYELLGRGEFLSLPRNPTNLIQIATLLGKDGELSALFREEGIARATTLDKRYCLFINTLPTDIELPALARALTAIRAQSASLPLVLEIHETAVLRLATLKELRTLLADLDIELAYDDFGIGQARLRELIEVPPDWLKFDRGLIGHLHAQPARSLGVLRKLVDIARDLGCRTIAEGIELREEMLACRDLGFDAGQGFYFGKPAPHFAS
ncbi:MAG: EAL domain-containing protein [Gammaproteobacteria bacterium]